MSASVRRHRFGRRMFTTAQTAIIHRVQKVPVPCAKPTRPGVRKSFVHCCRVASSAMFSPNGLPPAVVRAAQRSIAMPNASCAICRWRARTLDASECPRECPESAHHVCLTPSPVYRLPRRPTPDRILFCRAHVPSPRPSAHDKPS